MNDWINASVKSFSLPETSGIALKEVNEEFVDIFAYSRGEIKVNMQYVKVGIPSAITTAYVRKTVADKLIEAKKMLPDGYTFEVLDAWRPFGVQMDLFNSYKEQVIPTCPPDIKEDELIKKVCEFVSYPDKSKKIAYVHSSGGAVDLTVLDADGNRLEMGTGFDDFTEKSYTAWFEENDSSSEIAKNRRLLNNVLLECGFTNYPSEWWHYDYGDAFWAFYTHNDAIYSSKFEETEVKNND